MGQSRWSRTRLKLGTRGPSYREGSASRLITENSGLGGLNERETCSRKIVEGLGRRIFEYSGHPPLVRLACNARQCDLLQARRKWGTDAPIDSARRAQDSIDPLT